MRYLREGRKLLYVAAALPVFFIYLDKTIVLWIKRFYNELEIHRLFGFLDPLIDFAGNGATLVAVALTLYVAGRFFSQKMCRVGKSLLIGLVSSGIMVQAMKHLIGRARPRVTADPVFIGPSFRSGYDSFPSGHTTVVFCLAYILSRHFPRYKIAFYMFASVVALDRVEDFAHFPSDILAGAVLGLIVAQILFIKVFPSQGVGYAENTTESQHC